MLPHEKSAERVRVIHIAQSIAGGIASYFEEIAGYQADKFGRDNIFFVVPAEARYLPSIDSDQLLCFPSSSRGPAALLEFARAARTAVQRLQPDIVHLHSSFAGAVVRPMLATRPNRPLMIYCPHGWAFGIETSPAKQHAYAWLERRLARVTDLIHVNSRSEYDIAVRFGLPANKLQVLANGIASTGPPARPMRQGPLKIAFIGRHDRQKGLDILLDTVNRFPLNHIHFNIVGEGVLSKGVRDRRSAPPNVTFHGWLSRGNTLALLDQADAVVMPSRWDAAPIVAIEAMRAAVPVIGSNRGGIPEIVGDGDGGYIFDLDDPDSLGCLLQGLDRNGLDRLGSQARARWESRYDAKAMNAVTCAAYESLLTRSGAGA